MKYGLRSRKAFLFVLLAILCLVIIGNLTIETKAISERKVRQGALVITRSALNNPSSYYATWNFPDWLMMRMNVSVDVLETDNTEITNACLYDGEVGKYCIIFIASDYDIWCHQINSTELGILDAYEAKFGVAEVLYGGGTQQTSSWLTRYGISDYGTHQGENITKVIWIGNNVIETVDFKGSNMTLTANTTIYAYMGNSSSQTMPYLWSYTDSQGRVRVTGIANQGDGGYVGDTENFYMSCWLGLKLSPANKIIKYYFSFDIDDVNLDPDETGLHMTANDVDFVMTNLVNSLKIKPMMHVFIGSITAFYDLTTRYPDFYNKLLATKDNFDIGIHPNVNATSYQYTLDMVRLHLANLSKWGLEGDLLYFIPDAHLYNPNSALALQHCGYRFIAQSGHATNDDPPYCTCQKYDINATNLFRVPRWGLRGLGYNVLNMSGVLTAAGDSTWGEYYRFEIASKFQSIWRVGCNMLMTHQANFKSTEGGDQPAVNLTKTLINFNIQPFISVSPRTLANYVRFTQDYDFNVTYNIDAQTLTYDISKINTNAEDEIMLILPSSSSSTTAPLAIPEANEYVTSMAFSQESQILINLGTSHSKPYVCDYTTRLISTMLLPTKVTFTTIANVSGYNSINTVDCGNCGCPSTIYEDGINMTSGWNYNSTTKCVLINVTHANITPIKLEVIWYPEEVYEVPVEPLAVVAVGITAIVLAWYYRRRKKVRKVSVPVS